MFEGNIGDGIVLVIIWLGVGLDVGGDSVVLWMFCLVL